MEKKIIYCRHLLPFNEDESFQVFGEWPFYPNGGVKLGPVFYAYRTPIHRVRFGANLIALRYIDVPNILDIETPFGGELRFQYRPFFRRWYQLVEVDCPSLYAYQERFGSHLAIAIYNLKWAFKWAMIGVAQLLLYFFVVCSLGVLIGIVSRFF